MGDYGPYHSPENYGLEMIGDINWGTGYEFDMIVVWKRLEDGAFLWASDSGCSCPTPFEGHRLNDGIELIENLATFHALLLAKNAMAGERYDPRNEAAAITDLVTRLHGLGLR